MESFHKTTEILDSSDQSGGGNNSSGPNTPKNPDDGGDGGSFTCNLCAGGLFHRKKRVPEAKELSEGGSSSEHVIDFSHNIPQTSEVLLSQEDDKVPADDQATTAHHRNTGKQVVKSADDQASTSHSSAHGQPIEQADRPSTSHLGEPAEAPDPNTNEQDDRREQPNNISFLHYMCFGAGGGATNCSSSCSIIDPSSLRYRCWELFLLIPIFYTALAIPFELTFVEETKFKDILLYVETAISAIFLIDMVMSFFVTQMDKKTHLWIQSHREIASRYMIYFLYDIIAVTTIAFGWVQRYQHYHHHQYIWFFMIIRLVPILRLWRAGAIFRRWEKRRILDYIWIRGLKLAWIAIYTVHFAGCTMYFLAAHHDIKSTWLNQLDDSDHHLWGRYAASIYWSVVTVSTIGYGDFHPVNTRERVFNIVYVFFIMGFGCYILGNITQMFVILTERSKNYGDNIQAAVRFVQQTQLPQPLREELLAHLYVKYTMDSEGLQHEKFVDSLPRVIRSRILGHLFSPAVEEGENLYLFHGVSDIFRSQLVMEMKAEYFPPNIDVIARNEAPTDFYILVTGAVDRIATHNGMEDVSVVRRGEVFGEIGVLCHTLQPFIFRTKQLCYLLRLSCTTLETLAPLNVKDARMLMDNFLQRWVPSNDPTVRSVLEEKRNSLARSTKLPADLTADHLLRQFLRRASYIYENLAGKSIVVSCPQRGDSDGRVFRLPDSYEGLINLGRNWPNFTATKIMTKERALIDDIGVIQERQHIILASDNDFQP